MIRINLLPHREQKRAARQRQFVSIAIGLSVLALAVVGLVHVIFATQIENQQNRNKLLKDEIAKRRADQGNRQAARARRRRCSAQAGCRNAADQPHRGRAPARPDGAAASGRRLSAVAEAGQDQGHGDRLRINARVSTLMRNVEASPWLTQPNWSRSRRFRCRAPGQDTRVNEFTLSFQMKRAAPPPADAKAGPPGKSRPAGQGCPQRPRGKGSQGMTLDDIRRLNIREVGNWPLLPKFGLLAICCALAILAAGALDWRTSAKRSTGREEEEAKLKDSIAKKAGGQPSCPAVEEIEQSLQALLKRFPTSPRWTRC
jgi:type IV pilus assembly protein PilN